MKSQKSEKQREHEKLVLQLNEIFPTHSLQDLISAVKKSNFDLDSAIAIVLSEFPIPEIPQVPTPVQKEEKIKEKEVEPKEKKQEPVLPPTTVAQNTKKEEPAIPEEKIEKIQLVLSHLSRNTICKALLENDLDDDLTLLQLLNNPPEEDSLIPSSASKREEEEEEEEEENEEEEEDEYEEDNEFYGSSTPSDSDNDVEMEAWFVDPQIERQQELTRRYIDTIEKEAQIKRDEQIALNLQKLEEQRNKDKNMSFSTWATTDLSRIDICAYDNAKKDNYGNVKNNNSSSSSYKKSVAQSSVIVEPPSQEVRDFLDRIEERTVLELTGSIPPPKKSNQYTSIKLQNVLLDMKKRLAEYQGLKSKKLPWEILQEKLKNASISNTNNTTTSIPVSTITESLFTTITSTDSDIKSDMSVEEMKAKQNEEIEVLKSFYSQEFSESLSYPKRISVKLSNSPSLSIYIIFLIPPLYPLDTANVVVRSFSFLSIPENLILQLENYLQSMLKSKNSFLSVVQFCSDWLQAVAPTLTSNGEENPTNEYQDSFKFIVSGDYKCLSSVGLLEEQMQKIRNTCTSLNVSPSIARILLNHYKWQPKDLYKSYEESLRKGQLSDFYRSMELPVDLINNNNNSITVQDSEAEYECSSCFEEFPIKEMTSLYCNHRFCNDCFRSYLKIKIMESGTSVDVITCPGHKCKFIVDECTLGSLVPMDLYSKYTSFVTKSFVDRNPNLKYCPSKKCESIVLLNNSNSSTSSSSMIHCNCGLIWCYSCKLEAHWPATCEQIKWYNDTHHRQNQDPDASEKTLEWLSKYTQDCPKCKSPIEKNGGCNHLSCSHCKLQFCWVCRGEWTGGSHYNCSSPQSQSPADRELALRFSVTHLSFEQVYIINERSRVHDDQRIKSIATDRIKSYIQLPNATMEDCEIICAAIEHIFLCRHIILNICIMGQYFNKFKTAKGKKLKQWIENLQSSINLLSSVIDVPVKQINTKTIQDFTIAVQNAIKKLQLNLIEFKQQKNVNNKKKKKNL